MGAVGDDRLIADVDAVDAAREDGVEDGGVTSGGSILVECPSRSTNCEAIRALGQRENTHPSPWVCGMSALSQGPRHSCAQTPAAPGARTAVSRLVRLRVMGGARVVRRAWRAPAPQRLRLGDPGGVTVEAVAAVCLVSLDVRQHESRAWWRWSRSCVSVAGSCPSAQGCSRVIRTIGRPACSHSPLASMVSVVVVEEKQVGTQEGRGATLYGHWPSDGWSEQTTRGARG